MTILKTHCHNCFLSKPTSFNPSTTASTAIALSSASSLYHQVPFRFRPKPISPLFSKPLFSLSSRQFFSRTITASATGMMPTCKLFPLGGCCMWEARSCKWDGSRQRVRYVDVSTVDVATSKLIGEHIKANGASFLEAPVSGSKKPAEDGQLIFPLQVTNPYMIRLLPFRHDGKVQILSWRCWQWGGNETCRKHDNGKAILQYDGIIF